MSIYPDRKNGKLTGRFCVEVQRDGMRLRARCDTLKEAEAKERLFQSPSYVPPTAAAALGKAEAGPKTLKDAFDIAKSRLWRGMASEAIALANLERALSIIGMHRSISDLNTVAVDDLIVALMDDRGISDATVNRYLAALKKFARWMGDRGYLQSQPKFEWRDEDEGRIRWISEAEEASLYDLVDGDTRLIIYNAIETGMRASELLTLEPDQVKDGWVHLWETKSGSPRSIPVTEDQEKALRYLSDGRMPTYDQLRKRWDKARAAMGLSEDPWFVFHACRHTCATRLVQRNVNLAVIKQWMGHKNIKTTLRYAHVSDSTLREALTSRPTPGGMQHLFG